jgi:hypothetical protein
MLKKELLNNTLIDNSIDDFFYTETNSDIINPDIILSFENSYLNSPTVFNTIFNAINCCSETEDYDSDDHSIMNNKLFYKLKYNIVLYDLINAFLIKKINKIEYTKNKCIFNFVVRELKDRRKMKEYRMGYRVWKSLLGDKPEF